MKIEWTGDTWNPTTGCSHAKSPGCDNCYAERIAFRLGWGGLCAPGETREAYKEVIDPKTRRWNGRTALIESALEKPLHWKKPRKIFLDSMGDIFHDTVKQNWLLSLMEIVEVVPRHTYQILTKRPENMRDFFKKLYGYHESPYPNLHLGTTLCNQPEADANTGFLLDTPAAVRFLSIEPMLGPVNLGLTTANCNCCARWPSRWIKLEKRIHSCIPGTASCADVGFYRTHSNRHGALSIETQGGLLGVMPNEMTILPALDWVIVGGETGPRARPMHPDWVRSIRDQCVEAGVPFFFKGWGEWLPNDQLPPGVGILGPDADFPTHQWDDLFIRSAKVGKTRLKNLGLLNLLDGQVHQQFPNQQKKRP